MKRSDLWKLAGFCLLALGAANASATNFTWTGKAPPPANQLWSNVQNWSPSNSVPGAGDTAIIIMPGVVTVYVDIPVTVANVTAITATLAGAGSLTVSGTFEAQNAEIGPAGGTTITGTGMLSVDPVPDIPVYNTTTVTGPLTVNGSANVSSNAVFSIASGATVMNNRFFTLADGAQLILANSGASFVNNSSFTGGNSICSSSASVFSNAPSGAVYAQAGKTLQFQGTLANRGEFQPQSGAVMNISAATALHDGASITGPGNVLLTGNDTVDGTATVTGNLQFNGFAVTLNGTLEVQFGGNFIWLGGSLTGVGTNVTGTIQVDAHGTMVWSEENTLTLRNCVLTNLSFGNVSWSNNGAVFMGYNARIDNQGFFQIYGDATLSPLASGTPGYNSAVINTGSSGTGGWFEKVTGAADSDTTINVPLYNTDLVTVSAGKLILSAGGGLGARFYVSSEAVIQLVGGAYFARASQFFGSASTNGPPGTVILAAGGTINLGGFASLAVQGLGINFQQTGGTIAGNGEMNVNSGGEFTWSGGTILVTNPAAIIIDRASTMNISGANNFKTITAGGIVNNGTINWVGDNGGGGVYAGDNVVFENYGVFNLQCDAALNDSAVTVHPVFTNGTGGTITKTYSAAGTSRIGFRTVNYGTIRPQAGTTDFAQLDDNALGVVQLNGGNLEADSTTTLNGDIRGSGKITVSGGGLTVQGTMEADNMPVFGNLQNNGTTELGDAPGILTLSGNNFTQTTNGVMLVPIRGTNAAALEFGQLVISSYGQITLAGTLVAQITEGYAPPVGVSFPFLNSFQRNGTFNNVILPPGLQLTYTSGGATLVVTGTVPVGILSPAAVNGQFQFGFNTISNRSYTVQYSDDLAAGAWTCFTNFTGNGSYWPIFAPNTNAHRYFRVGEP